MQGDVRAAGAERGQDRSPTTGTNSCRPISASSFQMQPISGDMRLMQTSCWTGMMLSRHVTLSYISSCRHIACAPEKSTPNWPEDDCLLRLHPCYSIKNAVSLRHLVYFRRCALCACSADGRGWPLRTPCTLIALYSTFANMQPPLGR